ncbi:MAG: enoyl-CoA hydratase/isomerase family protein [Bradyrhizobium sp.]|uniref:enoyl-CoA hydratase/isomerase family protein n=1 Tax=Bradyrhizobium sp. TaxID=376 RepID=UPI003D13C607
MDTELIKVTVTDGIAVVTMDNPPVNAQNAQFNTEMAGVMDVLSDRRDVRVVVLTGAGKVFSAGADLKARPDRSQPGARWQHNRRARESYHAIRECTKPVIAAINGPALGAGLALAASCDILFAADEASLGLPEIDVGLLGGGKHTQRLFPHSTLRRMMLTGYRVPGPELVRLGVVEASVPRADLMARVLEVAAQIAAKSPTAIRLAKRTLNTIEDMSLRDGYRYEQNMTAELSDHPDSKEAATAFLEKRPPRFQGD